MEEALADTLESTITMVRHPVQTFRNISVAVAHPIRTAHALKQLIKSECQKDEIWECFGYGFGHMLVFVLTEGAGIGVRAAGLGTKSSMTVYSVEAAHAGGLVTHITFHTDEYYRKRTVIAVPVDFLPGRFVQTVAVHQCSNNDLIFRINNSFNISFPIKLFDIPQNYCPTDFPLNPQ